MLTCRLPRGTSIWRLQSATTNTLERYIVDGCRRCAVSNFMSWAIVDVARVAVASTAVAARTSLPAIAGHHSGADYLDAAAAVAGCLDPATCVLPRGRPHGSVYAGFHAAPLRCCHQRAMDRFLSTQHRTGDDLGHTGQAGSKAGRRRAEGIDAHVLIGDKTALPAIGRRLETPCRRACADYS